MARRNRKRSRPQPQRPKAPAPPAQEAPVTEGFAEIRDELREDFGLVVESPEKYDPAAGDPVLRRLLDGLRRGELTEQEQTEIDIGLNAAGLAVSTMADAEEVEEAEEEAAERIDEELAEARDRQADIGGDDEGDDDFVELEELPPPEIEIPELERGPLAGGILMMEAMLTEAKAGYITAQITVLEEAINEEFTLHERTLMADAASKWRDASGLPDVPAAYRALVIDRAMRTLPG